MSFQDRGLSVEMMCCPQFGHSTLQIVDDWGDTLRTGPITVYD